MSLLRCDTTSRILVIHLCILEMFKSPRFQDVSLNQWMALTPPELVQSHLNQTVMGSLRKEKWPVIKNSNDGVE